MRRNTKQSEKNEKPLSIRSGVWASMLGVALLGIVALSLSRKGEIKDRAEQSFEVASSARHSSFAKVKRTFERSASSPTSQEHLDEIDALDFSVLNDRSRWVDPAWLP